MASKFFIVLVLIFSLSLLPVFTPRTEAFLGIGDFGFDIEDVVKFALDAVAVPIAQQMVDEIVKSTIRWANAGFEGNPAYVTDPGQYFTNLADNVAGEFIRGSELGFLCSPFQNSIRLSLARQYYQPPQSYFQCTFTGVRGNLEDFYRSFHNGGWQGWFSMTQVATNNPYDAFLRARIELDSRIEQAVGLEREQLSSNLGFKDYRECLVRNPDEDTILGLIDSGQDTPEGRKKAGWDPSKPPLDCIEWGPTKTPGSVIKAQLDRVLPSGLERLINADQMSELVGAFASGLLQRYVFSSKGLFASNAAGSAEREVVDVDGDEIPDGYDTDGDGQLDICHHGLKPRPENASASEWGPSSDNCFKSTEVRSSPYFTPICERLARTAKETDKYLEFLEKNPFDGRYRNTWLNRTTSLSGAVDDLSTALTRLEIQAYDPAIFYIDDYNAGLQRDIEKLAKDGKLNDPRLSSDIDGRGTLKRHTLLFQKYLSDFKTSIGRCDAPDTNPVLPATPETESLPLDTGTSTPAGGPEAL